ncbi:GNAT family N-acetyltransferase [Streptomyces sp. NPDC005538]|uniref:GNAT family N-acetyltransferase n=1 Tax=Streptomyces sp. NPDC005538 TaxID=3157043 RepID=UPI0033A79CA9
MGFPWPRRLEGLELHVADWKGTPLHRWPGRQVIAVVQGRAAGHVEFYLHPDALALEVSYLEVAPGFRSLGLASLLMDRLYETYPQAWINHGRRSVEGAHWWDQYRDPSPERNIHNRPPADWARYFRAPSIAADRVVNRGRNKWYDLDGHRAAEYRYGERLEEEYQGHAQAFEPDTGALRADPARQHLYAAQVVVLPPGLHRHVHDPDRDATERAQALLEHIGHGNLPRSSEHTGYWNTSSEAALTDAWLSQLFDNEPPASPATHLVYQAHPLGADGQEVPQHVASMDWVDYTDPEDISVDLAGMSWRSTAAFTTVHHADFDPPVPAAAAPEEPQDASPQYRARYTEQGMLRTPVEAAPISEPFDDRRDEIKAMAHRLIRDSATRSAQAEAPRPDPPAAGRSRPDPRLPPPAPTTPRHPGQQR